MELRALRSPIDEEGLTLPTTPLPSLEDMPAEGYEE
jgi:hypothetical protein